MANGPERGGLKIEETSLPGVMILTPRRFEDARGFFCEVWNKQRLRENGLDFEFVQDNQSISRAIGVIRGLHAQAPPHAQDKLVRVGRGAVLDVAVDIRVGSPSFGKWVGVELSADNGRQLLIPKGFLHGFVTLSDEVELLYKCSDYYAPECEISVRFDDSHLGIDWGSRAASPILSDKDLEAPAFAEIESPFRYEGQK